MVPLFTERALALSFAFYDLWSASQAVVTMRLLPFAGIAPWNPGEAARMFAEKAPAMAESGLRAQKVALAGGRPDEVMLAALGPLTRTARGNRSRLTR